MKKTELKRTGIKQKRPKKRVFTDFDRMARAIFRDAARDQMVCAICGKGGHFDSHHVLAKQELKRRKLGCWDPRNSLRVHRDCHLSHEQGATKIKLSALTPANIEYVNEVLGEAADDYLRRHYD